MASERPARVAVGIVGLLAVVGTIVGWLSFGGVDARGDWAHALDAVARVAMPGDIVFVADAEVPLPDGPFLRGEPGSDDLRGFARVLALRPPGSQSPPTAEIRRFGGVELSVWKPDSERLVGSGADVLPVGTAEVVRGSVRLPCEAEASGPKPFSCNRAGGLIPLELEGAAVRFTPSATGFVEFRLTHPAGASHLEVVAGPAGLKFDAREGFGAGVVTLAAGDRLDRAVQPGTPLVLAIGPGQGGEASLRWWTTTSDAASPAADAGCHEVGAAARDVGQRSVALYALRRGASGLSCERLRMAAKPAR